MISAETLAQLEARKLLYILGTRERPDRWRPAIWCSHEVTKIPKRPTRHNSRRKVRLVFCNTLEAKADSGDRSVPR